MKRHPPVALAAFAVFIVAVIAVISIAFVVLRDAEPVCGPLDTVTCTTDAQCGPTGPYGTAFCRGDDRVQPHYRSTCAGGKGTCTSQCLAQQTEVVETCENGCARGACL